MKYKCLFFLVMGLLMVSACTPDTEQEQPAKQMTTEADIAAIKDLVNQYGATINAGDLDLWISLWADHAIQMAPDAPAVIGKEKIRARRQSLFDLYDWKMTVDTEEVRVAGDWAFARGTYTYTKAPKEEGATTKGTGKWLSIFEKQDDGSWKMTRDCYNSNVSPSAPK